MAEEVILLIMPDFSCGCRLPCASHVAFAWAFRVIWCDWLKPISGPAGKASIQNMKKGTLGVLLVHLENSMCSWGESV